MGFFDFFVYIYASFSSMVTTIQLMFKPSYIRKSIEALRKGRRAFDDEVE